MCLEIFLASHLLDSFELLREPFVSLKTNLVASTISSIVSNDKATKSEAFSVPDKISLAVSGFLLKVPFEELSFSSSEVVSSDLEPEESSFFSSFPVSDEDGDSSIEFVASSPP